MCACRPAELAKEIKLSFHEVELMKQLLTKYDSTAVCRGASCACKKTTAT